MKEGDVILTPVPQADGSIKNRPLVRDMEYIFEVKANSELKFEPATVLQKLNDESNKCTFAVVVMTGDDISALALLGRARM
jgi:predicted nucleotide-binding protein